MKASIKWLTFIALVVCSSVQAQQNDNPDVVTISDLSWTDESFLSQQRARIDRLARENLGSQIRGDKSDLSTLQRIIDRELVKKDDTITQQALGVVLGDVMLKDEQELTWKVYEDKVGRSRALCAMSVEECLFPVTMLSRRMRVGLKPDVKKVYVEALELIAESLPKLPYGEVREYKAY
ncbi:DUF3806 domain-containing protein [Gilvimarinus sp. DA14]|uniref:DUF3806 domain-containing protein n=1 Tax=Gilvimarinus sp. DA14 TaxID=2956798 RepID=UPI0020B72C30|nr:DUF3806 domain-containing protein [Gilvimarinus sp. DA14]UTF60455.1 DUF3806 domain-containing protein [Gilvimarinus sp. DA14]